MRAARVAFYAAVVVLVLVSVAAAWAVRFPPLAPTDPPQRAVFSDDLIHRGAVLASLGDCATCHTAPNGAVLAGGYPIPTQFGTIYSTNITPDRDTGIGTWSEAAFRRAMREGIDRDGENLYPAFPYNHFTNATDDDIAALYAFFMTRPAVNAAAPPNQLPFPLNLRIVLAGWNLLNLHPGPYQTVAGQSAEWNRGAYLAEGLGHCSSCHTPLNAIGAEKGGTDHFGGGSAEGWDGPALNASAPAPAPWTADEIAQYLADGHANAHGWAGGPMQAVAFNLAVLPPDDLNALGTYVSSFSPQTDAPKRTDAAVAAAEQKEYGATRTVGAAVVSASPAAASTGQSIFAGLCATCHRAGGGYPEVRPVALGLSSVVTLPDPDNFVQIVLNGIQPLAGQRAEQMPGFADTLTDDQVAALADYVRAHYAGKAAWGGVDKAISEARQQSRPAAPQSETAFNAR